MALSYNGYAKLLLTDSLLKAVDAVQNSEKIISKLAKKGENVITLGVMGNGIENEKLSYNKDFGNETKSSEK